MPPVRVKCPTCQRELDWATAPFRPFCGERCRLIDLGAWLSEQHAIPEESRQPEEESYITDRPPAKGENQ